MFAEAKAACEGRASVVETNVRSFIKAGKVGAIEALLPGSVGGLFNNQQQRQQSQARAAYKEAKNWVFAATNVTAKRCAGQSWMAGHYKDAPQADKKKRRKAFFSKSADQPGEIEHDKNHPVLWLLDKPNRIQGKSEFIHITVMNLLLTGEWYWIGGVTKKKNGEQKAEVWAVPSSWMVPVHKEGMFTGYKLQTGYGEGVDIPPENVARGYFPDPSDIKGCLSPLASCVQAAKIDDYILNSQEASFERGINPNLIITIGKGIGPDGKPVDRRPTLKGAQRRQIVRAVRHIWSQTVNQGDPAILDGLIEDVKKLQMTPQEMDWKQSGEVVKARIFQAFGVNAIVVGEITPSNKAQAVVAETNFCGNVVNPILDNISSAASEFFGQFYEDGESLGVWLEEAVPKDDEREDRQWNQARQNNDITQEENRARLKLEPLPKKPPERSPLLNNPQTMTAIANLCAQVAGGALGHDEAVQILVTTLQISPKDAEAMVPDDPPEPTPEELAAQQAAQQGPFGGKPGGPPQQGAPPAEPPPKKPKKPPAKELDMEALAKSLAGMLTLKWEEEDHPRDEGGRFTDSPGQSMLPGLEDANKPGDNPQASLKERAAYAVRRAETLAAAAEENGETVAVASSWDDIDDTTKSEAESSWVSDHIFEYEEPYYDEWKKEVESEKEKEVENDEDFGREVFVAWAADQGYSEESANAAYQGQTANPKDKGWLYVPDIDADQLRWDDNTQNELAEMHQGDSASHHFSDHKMDMVEHWEGEAKRVIEEKVQEEVDNGPPDGVTEGAYSDASEAFGNLDDAEKLEYAGVGGESMVEEPKVYQPISDGKDYEKTRTVVRYLQSKIMDEELAARGIVGHDKVDEEAVAALVWSEWKSSSTSDYGLLLQYATAQELGGLSQKWTAEQMQRIQTAGKNLSDEYGGNNIEGMPTGAERIQWKADRGIEIAKAHVHATWAATQYAMAKAEMDHLDVYRGLMLDKKMVEALPKEEAKVVVPDGQDRTTEVRVGVKLPTLQLQRYGAASTTTDRSVANSWQGVGVGKNNSEMTRVVMRVRAPRESIVSIPAFGQNVHSEEEIVLAGAKEWHAWDAWLDKAPVVEEVPIKSVALQAKRRRMVVVFQPKQTV